jgi:hypothetical protein
MPTFENVGHYSVRPDFATLTSVPLESVVGYVLDLIYSSTSVLVDKQRRLGGFDAQRFRSELRSACERRGYQLTATDER